MSNNGIGKPPVRKEPYQNRFIPNKSIPIALTGANGFIGSHIVERLLKSGYKVKAGVNGPVQHLKDLDPTGTLITLHTIDLLDPNCFDELLNGCEAAIHTASPVNYFPKDPIADLVLPAVDGTLNMLNACLKNGIKKVVVTGSISAITEELQENTTEEDWNQKSHAQRLPYHYSKAKSEKALWEWHVDHPEIQVVVINPSVILGPYHSATGIPESNKELLGLITADIDPDNSMIMKYPFRITDVRDVARAHLLILENPDTFGRYICGAPENHMMDKAIAMILEDFPELSPYVPKMKISSEKYKKLFANNPKVQFRVNALDRTTRYKSTRIRSIGMNNFFPFRETVKDTIIDIIRKQQRPLPADIVSKYGKFRKENPLPLDPPPQAEPFFDEPNKETTPEPQPEVETKEVEEVSEPIPPPQIPIQPISQQPPPSIPPSMAPPQKQQKGPVCWCW